VLPICIPVDGPMRQEHLLGLDGACQRCHARLGPAPLPAPPQPLLVDRVAPPPRAPEVLRHEIQVAPEILEPPAPAAPAVEKGLVERETGRALTDEELAKIRRDLRREVKNLLDDEPEGPVFNAGLVLWAGLLCGYKLSDVADFVELPRAFCAPVLRRLRACRIVAWGSRGAFLSHRVRQRFIEDGEKDDGFPFMVRFNLFVLVALGQAEYNLHDDMFRLAQKGLDVVEAGA